MKILFAIASCQSWEDNGNNQAVRDTWMKDIPACRVDGYSECAIDCKFFQGHGSTPKDDLVIVNAPDDALGIIQKTKAIHIWAYYAGYDFVFQCWPDTYVKVDLLLKSGFEKYDYLGRVYPDPGPISPHGFLVGGDGWWASRRASQAIANAAIITTPQYNDGNADDLWAGFVIGEAGLKMVDHPDYGKNITLHGSVATGGIGTYKKEWMYKTYDNRR